MIADVTIRIILDTSREANARTVLARVGNLIEFDLHSLVPYSKGGFEANISTRVTANTWPEVVQSVIEMAQSLAYGWRLGGSIGDELELGAAGGFRISGVLFAWIVCTRPNA